MFKRTHHQQIAFVLLALKADLLRQLNCYFGGGTAIALRCGEYRESVDIDLMTSDGAAYRELRMLAKAPGGMLSFFDGRVGDIQFASAPRIDQYGIRTAIVAGAGTIKFEIILEARIDFDVPGPTDIVCGVSCLSSRDLIATKLLANSDRWADPGVFNRDLIDLAMMMPSKNLFEQALVKAESAYGQSVKQDLFKALSKLLDKPDWLERCMRSMRMETSSASLVMNLIRISDYLKSN